MTDFVINEWLWADSAGINGLPAQREALDFIAKLAASDHRIVVIEGSSFDQKAWKLCKSTNTIISGIGRAYLTSVRQNSDRCLILKSEAATTVPDVLALATKFDDHYLLQAQLSVIGAILVTTDRPLHAAVTKTGLICLFREEFLNTYF